ncbi:MAG: single-stranded DNA-binding protein [bacterium]|nr:single-stranded DNA-binding protein [bacterium]
MAGSFNKVLLMGNLTRDIEIRHTGSNTAVGNFGLAVNRRYKTQSGDQREEVTFVDCEAWGRTAEVMSQYLSKGRAVFIEGRLKLDQWEDRNGGGKRSKLSVVVENFQFVDSGQGGGGNQGGGGGGGGGYARSGAGGSGGGGGGADIDHDDIPF